jgi:pimeloyl-ACP methyl ester carboxylesterase
VIGNPELSQAAFHMLAGQRLLPAWGRSKTRRHFDSADTAALRGYYRMWLEEDFSADVIAAGVATPLRVIGGRQDLPGFQEEHLRATFGACFPRVDFRFITDAGHYPMQETPVYLASLMEGFLGEARA